MNIISVNNVSFSYRSDQKAVDDVSFELKKGDYVSIIGHNGSGKSTLAKLLVGLLETEKGSIEVNGLKLISENVYEIREKLAIVFQNPDNQFIGSTVRDDIAFGLENKQIPSGDMEEIIQHFASEVGMLEFLDHEPTKLSGGQKQRVAIAGVLAMNPEILILDEATSMLDPKGKKEVNELVEKLHKKNKMTIISITHDIEEVLLSDDVIVMNKGKMIMHGQPKHILKNARRMEALGLDIPFTFKWHEALKKQGIRVNSTRNLEGMVEELCQLNSKM